jgi:tetratricopeptide (TPR) repeat protein
MRNALGVTAAALAICIFTSSSVSAQESNGYENIALGNYGAAEREISAQRRLFPHDADLLINLGTIYLHTGRTAEARAVFQDVLTRPNEELDVLKAGSRWSHVIARDTLARLDPVVMSLR